MGDRLRRLGGAFYGKLRFPALTARRQGAGAELPRAEGVVRRRCQEHVESELHTLLEYRVFSPEIRYY